ncbi:MAG: hypothetical protein EOP49_21540 [Sphingobacteriales bacterium]|nr:MAG: hypothetical protein EOP49_21540 [Sphingobacteriales bacterium]
MKYALSALLLLILSCGDPQRHSETIENNQTITAPPVSTGIDTLCYLSTGPGRDTGAISLYILPGGQVEGVIENKPWEKDSRKGLFTGSMQDSMIRGLWVFTQEGITDTLPAAMKLKTGGLSAQPYIFDPKQGREVLSETGAQREYQLIPCLQ